MTDLHEEIALRESICRYGRSLFERGLTPGSSGNISLRLDDGGWLVTPTNASLGFLDPARLSRLDAKGQLVSGDKPAPVKAEHAARRDWDRTLLRGQLPVESRVGFAANCEMCLKSN